MHLLIIICLLLFGLVMASSTPAQTSLEGGPRPVSRRDVRRALVLTQDDAELSRYANQELIAEVERRGVDFVLSTEEEWAFSLLEASDELLEKIRSAVPADQREAFLTNAAKRRLYAIFMAGYNKADPIGRRSAYEAGKEYVDRFRSDQAVKDNVAFISRFLPQLERSVRYIRTAPPRARIKN